jgi:hypothetical protein
MIPKQPTYTTCLCKQYHTNFTSQFYKIKSNTTSSTTSTSSTMQISPSISVKRFNSITDELPASPISKLQLSQLFNSSSPTSSFNTDPTPIIIVAHTHHAHTCAICKIKDLPCVDTKDKGHSPDYTIAILFKNHRLIHRSCISKLTTIPIKPLPQIRPLNKDQKITLLLSSIVMMPAKEKIKRFKNLKIYTKAEVEQLNFKQQQQNQQHEHQQEQHEKTLIDFFNKFPITPEMEKFTTLNTPLAKNIFHFIKPDLANFRPGQVLKKAKGQQTELKANFEYLIKSMASKRPKFLTELIYKFNPQTHTEAPIPFNILYTNFKSILGKFTSTLFSKLNYHKILTSLESIPPNTIQNRIQVALNLARLHLYLNEGFQSIDYKKFAEDLNIKPRRLKLIYYKNENQLNKMPFLTINNDKQFNIYVHLNIPTLQFLNTFQVPSLKKCKPQFDEWYERFFSTYSRQFTEINKEKTYNYLKYQIAQQFATACKQFLPDRYNISEIFSLQDRINKTKKLALFHIHKCDHSTEKPCTLLGSEVEHNFKNLNNYYFKTSFTHFPTSKWIDIPINLSLFNKDQPKQASFQQPTPLQLFNTLATEHDEKLSRTNHTEPNTKRKNFLFYQIFKCFLKIAAENDEINNLTLAEAKDKLTPKPINTHHLARVIAYYSIKQTPTISIPEILDQYKTTFFPEAEQFLNNKFSIKFDNLVHLEELALFNSELQNAEQEMEIDDLYTNLKTPLQNSPTTTPPLSPTIPPFQ